MKAEGKIPIEQSGRGLRLTPGVKPQGGAHPESPVLAVVWDAALAHLPCRSNSRPRLLKAVGLPGSSSMEALYPVRAASMCPSWSCAHALLYCARQWLGFTAIARL